MIERVGFPEEGKLRSAQTPEEHEFLRRLTEFGDKMANDYGVARIEWSVSDPPKASLTMKATMADGVYFEAEVHPLMFADLITKAAPTDDFFEHMHRELTLRVDEHKRGMYEPREPDTDQYILAFREWTVDWDKLTIKAIGVTHTWDEKPVWQTAECKSMGRYQEAPYGHEAPHPKCHCGFYGWWKFGDQQEGGYGEVERPPRVWGVIQAKGRIEVHADGIRAEFIRPVMLAVPESSTWFLPKDPSDPARGGEIIHEPREGALPVEPKGAANVRKLAKKMGLDAVAWSYVMTKASEYGILVPDEFIPGKDPEE